MKKITKFVLAIIATGILQTSSALTQTIDISTGVNSTSAMIPFGSFDDTWTVKFPSSSSFVNLYSGDNILWNLSNPIGCGRWISPEPLMGGVYSTSTVTGPGNYTYRMSFTPNQNCPIVSAKIVFNYTMADNQLNNIRLNGVLEHTYSPPILFGGTWNPNTPYTINLNPGNISSGINTLDMEVFNALNAESNWTVTGLALCAYIEITYGPDLTASLSGADEFCKGGYISQSWNNGTGVYSNFSFSLIECDITGTILNPSNTWNSGTLAGVPGNYPLNALATMACNTYYLVTLNVSNICGSSSTTKVIYIKCPPTVNIGPDQSICEGSCITLNSGGPIKKHTYVWSILGDEPVVIGSGSSITVCPTNTTTYCVTSTQSGTGCTATDCITITVLKTKPDFTLASNINPGDNYFTTLATPVNNAATVASIPGFGYAWIVEEIVSTSNPTVISGSMVSNSSCWWNPTLTTNFNGYDGPYFTSTSNTGNPMHLGCSNPNPGRFTAGHTYRITRGTWSTSCPWSQYSVIVYLGHTMIGSGAVVVQEDPNAPDYSYLSIPTSVSNTIVSDNTLSVFPNPSNGVFSIQLSKAAKGTIEVFDAFGKKVQTIAIIENTSDYKLDLSKYTKGVYMLNMITEGEKISKKIIVE